MSLIDNYNNTNEDYSNINNSLLEHIKYFNLKDIKSEN